MARVKGLIFNETCLCPGTNNNGQLLKSGDPCLTQYHVIPFKIKIKECLQYDETRILEVELE